jgi:hypothetical protein
VGRDQSGITTNVNIPENLIFGNSKIEVSLDTSGKLNRTLSAIVLEGNQNGFLSLSNCLIFLANELHNEIDLAELPFVTAHVGLIIRFDESAGHCPSGLLTRVDDSKYAWALSETESNSVFTAIHSLGHLNYDLHLDSAKAADEISVYCSVMK